MDAILTEHAERFGTPTEGACRAWRAVPRTSLDEASADEMLCCGEGARVLRLLESLVALKGQQADA